MSWLRWLLSGQDAKMSIIVPKRSCVWNDPMLHVQHGFQSLCSLQTDANHFGTIQWDANIDILIRVVNIQRVAYQAGIDGSRLSGQSLKQLDKLQAAKPCLRSSVAEANWFTSVPRRREYRWSLSCSPTNVSWVRPEPYQSIFGCSRTVYNWSSLDLTALAKKNYCFLL